MVGGNDGFIAHRLSGFHHLPQTLIYRLDGCPDGCVYACMSHHIAVGEISNDPVVLLCFESLHQLVFNLVSRHLWLHVIRKHIGRLDQNTVFTFEWLLTPSIDKECHVGIFLRLSDM